MKPRLIVCLAAITVAAALVGQDRQAELKHLLVPCCSNGDRPVTVIALEIERELPYNGIDHLKGNVEIRTPVCVTTGPNHQWTCNGYVVLRADQADFHEDTGQIEASGNVQVTREPYVHQAATVKK